LRKSTLLARELYLLENYRSDKSRSAVDLARELGISYSRVLELTNHGRQERTTKAPVSPLTERQEKNIIKLYLQKDGPTVKRLAEKYKLPTSQIERLIVQYEVQGSRRREQQSLRQSIIDLWLKGKSSKTISARVNLSRYKVAKVILRWCELDHRTDKLVYSILRSPRGIPFAEVSNLVYLSKLTGDCSICGNFSRLCLDHCHRTGLARGLLCQKCNHGLGFFRDDPRILESAILYLSRLLIQPQ
jgi:hypothetical protein